MAYSIYGGKGPSDGKEVFTTFGSVNVVDNINDKQESHKSVNIFKLCDDMDNDEEAQKIMISYLFKKQQLDSTIINNLNFQQKEELQRGIQCLDNDSFDPLLNMLQMYGFNIDKNDDSIELDYDSIEGKLLVKMYNYVLEVIQQKENERINRNECNSNNNINTDQMPTLEKDSDVTDSTSNSKKRKMKFVDDSKKKRQKYDDKSYDNYSEDMAKYVKKIKKIKKGMDKYVLDYEIKMQQVTDQQQENVQKIQDLQNIIEKNRKKEMELIHKCDLFQKQNKNLNSKNMEQNKLLFAHNGVIAKLQQTNNKLTAQKLKQKQEFEHEINETKFNLLKSNGLIKQASEILSNEQKLTKQLKQQIININQAKKQIEKLSNEKCNKLQKQNKELTARINLLNGNSDRINVLSIEELNKLKSTLDNGIKAIQQAKDRKIIDKCKCIICWENDKNILIDKCKHISLCDECLINRLEKKICPICQSSFTTVTHIRL